MINGKPVKLHSGKGKARDVVCQEFSFGIYKPGVISPENIAILMVHLPWVVNLSVSVLKSQ